MMHTPLSQMYRFPDLPMEAKPSIFDTLGDATYLAQLKFNGWRAMYEWDGSALTIWGRHKRALVEPTPGFLADTARWMRERELPPCLFDGEWMGRRDKDKAQVDERAWLFDMLAVNGAWIGGQSVEYRWAVLGQFAPPELVVPCVTGRYREFFDMSRTVPGAEGIVLKRTGSRFFGKVDKSFLNPAWIKVKWRGGEDGNLALN